MVRSSAAESDAEKVVEVPNAKQKSKVKTKPNVDDFGWRASSGVSPSPPLEERAGERRPCTKLRALGAMLKALCRAASERAWRRSPAERPPGY